MAKRIVGLDIGSYAIKAVVLEAQRRLEVVEYYQVEVNGQRHGEDGTVDEGEEEAGGDWEGSGGEEGEEEVGAGLDDDRGFDPAGWIEALSELKARGVFEEAHEVITCFPDGQAVMVHLDVPFGKPKEVAEILPPMLSDELPVSLSEVIHDFIVVPGRDEEGFEAIVGVVKRGLMSQFLGNCQRVQIDPAVVGVPELMLRYVGEEAAGEEVGAYGVIDMGHRFTRLLIVEQGKPVVAHHSRRGGAQITEVLSENFQIGLDEAEVLKHREAVVGAMAAGGDRQVRKLAGTIEESLRPLIRDLRRTFQSAYARQGVAVDEIYLCGGSARIGGIEDHLQEEFQVPVKRLDARMDRLDWRAMESPGEVAPEAGLALGCALQRPVDDGEEYLIDLRREEFVYRGKTSFLRQQIKRYGAVALVLVIMLTAVLALQYMEQRAQLQAMQQALAEQTQQVFGEAVDDPTEVQARLEGEAVDDRQFIPSMSAYELMVRVLEQVEDDMALEFDRIEVDTDRSLIQMVAETDSPQSVDRIADQIERLECLGDVSKDQVNVQSDDRVQFELQISSNC